MKRQGYARIVLLLGIVHTTLYSEFLIVKKVPDATGKEIFAPLDLEGKADNAAASLITNILLTYEWPMCTASDLKPAKVGTLLEPNVPRAEEVFIQKEFDQQLKDIGKYYVVFIPTSLYELFCLELYFADPIKSGFSGLFKKNPPIDLSEILKRTYAYKAGEHDKYFEDVAQTKNEILGIFVARNKEIYNAIPMKENAFFILNNYIVNALFAGADLQAYDHAAVLASLIQKKLNTTIESLVKSINKSKNSLTIDLQYELENRIVSKVAALEYEARELNKGLLLRGAYFTSVDLSLKPMPSEKQIMGIPFVAKISKYTTIEGSLNNAEQYSVSYGTSLFAGVMRDETACVYAYLSMSQQFRVNEGRATGYALFVDKKAYIENQNNNLFFIPPLAPLVGIFQRGEYFHARGKVSVAEKAKNERNIKGLVGSIVDQLGFFTVTRDPFRHAQLFTEFLVNNGRIIQIGDANSLTQEEKIFVERVMKNQAQSAQFYQDLRKVVPPVRKGMQKWAAKKETARREAARKKLADEQAQKAAVEKKRIEPLLTAIEQANLSEVKKLLQEDFNPEYEMTMEFRGKKEEVNLWVFASKLRFNKVYEILERGTKPNAEEIQYLVTMTHIMKELLKNPKIYWDIEDFNLYEELLRNPLLQEVKAAWVQSVLEALKITEKS